MSKKILSFLLIACMLSTNMLVPSSYALTANDAQVSGNLEQTQDSAAPEETDKKQDGKDDTSSPEQKTDGDVSQGTKEDENQNNAPNQSADQDAQKGEDENSQQGSQDNTQDNTQGEQPNPQGEQPSVQPPMVTVPDTQTPLGIVDDVLAQDTGAIIKQLAPDNAISSYLRITEAVVGTTGDDKMSVKTLKISMENDSDNKFYEILQNLRSVSIDDLNVPLRDEQDGMPTFIMTSNNANSSGVYMAFYNTFTGKKVIDDFEKRDKHKILMTFSDGSIVEYKDDGYTTPEGRDEDNGGLKPEPPTTGSAAEYEINESFVEKGWGDPEIKITFKKGDIGVLNTLVDNVKVSGYKDPIEGSAFAKNYKNEFFASIKDDTIKKGDKKAVTVVITFKDGSVLSNAGNDKPEVHQPRVVKGYIITADKSKTSYVDKILTRDVHVDPTDHMIAFFLAYEVKLVFKDLTVGNETYKVKSVKYVGNGNLLEAKKSENQTFSFDIPAIAVLPETSTNDTDIDIIVELDKKVDGYDNPTAKLLLKLDWNGDFKQPEEEKDQPDQKMADGYLITGTNVIENRFNIELNKEITDEHLKNIKSVIVNGGTPYETNTYSFQKEGKVIYHTETTSGEDDDEDELFSNVKNNKIDTLDIVFKDDSKISYKKEEKPQPSEKIADNYKIDGTKVTDDRFIINLNKEMSDDHLSKLKIVSINGTGYQTHTYTFKKDGNSIFVEEDEDEYAEIIPKVKSEGIKTLELVFADESKVIYKKEEQNTGKLADKFQLKNHILDNSNTFILSFSNNLTADDVAKIKSVKINDKEFTRDEGQFTLEPETGRLQTANAAVVSQVEKNKYDIVIEVKFTDDSVTRYTKKTEKPAGGFADKFKLKDIKTGTNWQGVVDKVILQFITSMTVADRKEVESIKINNKVFEKDTYSFFTTREGELSSENEEVVKWFLENQYDLYVEVKFKDGSITKFEKNTPKPVEKLAEKYKLTKAELTKTQFSQRFTLTFGNKVAKEDVEKIVNIKINGKEFERSANGFVSAFGGAVETENADVIAEVEKNKNDLKIEVKFSDDSVTKLDTKIEEAGLSIDSNLPDGSYTLTFKAYIQGKNQTETSTLEGYFDKRVKLEVSSGKKTVSFLNHIYPELILDLAVEQNGKFVPFTKKVVEQSTNGTPKKVEYTVELDSLTGVKNIAVLGSGPMGGTPDDIGHYEKSTYRKADLVFDRAVTKGWSNFEVIEKEKKQKENNEEILMEALAENGLDTNRDGKISVDELQNAVGKQKPKSIQIDGFPENNVLNLENKGITDISMLKDLGPKIRGINLNGNKIESLPNDVFANATGVTHLALGANKISSIGKDTFKSLKNLAYLDLDGSPLVSLPEGIFDENTKLDILGLTNTALESVPDNLIKNNTRLTELYLQENKIKRLPDDFFANNRRLTRLTINSSELENLPSSLGTDKPYLTTLEAQNNRITSIPASFANLKNITRIKLANNRISDIPDEFFVAVAQISNSKNVNLELSANDIKFIPVDKIISALNSGKEIKFIQLDMNMLPSQLSSEEMSKYRKIGVNFTSPINKYYPQKTNLTAKAVAEKGKVKLEQNFDVLELFYWGLSDVVNQETKTFNNERDFLNHLIGEGRDNNLVSRDLPRDEAVARILNNKGVEWKVDTVITDSNGSVVYSSTKNHEKEGQVQELSVANLQKDVTYTLTKTMYTKYYTEWVRQVEYSVNFTPQDVDDKSETVKVKMNQSGTDKPSMANPTLRPTANLEKVGNKFRYTLFFKPMVVFGQNGEIEEFFITKNGQDEQIPVKVESGEYNKSFTFDLDEKVEKLPVAFKVKGMPSTMRADIVFEYENAPKPKPPVNPEEKIVKGHILSADGKSISMADQSLDRDVKYKKTDKKSGPFKIAVFTIKFNEMTVGNQKAGVDGLSVKLKDTWMEAKPVEGQKGVFTFEMLENAIKPETSTKDTILDIKFKVTAAGHDVEREAKLLLDWNGDFVSPNPNPDQEQVFEIGAALKKAGTNEDSMANRALVDKAKVVYKDGVYKYTLTFKPIELLSETGKITSFAIEKDGSKQYLNLAEDGELKTVTFELGERVEKIRAYVHADIMAKIGMNEQTVDVIFDWTNAPKPPAPQALEMGATLTEQNGVVIANIDEQAAIENIEKLGNPGTLTIKVNADPNKTLQVSIPKTVLQKASDKENVSIVLDMPLSKMTLNKAILSQLANEDNVKLTVKKADISTTSQRIKDIVGTRPAVDFEFTNGNNKITQFNSSIKIEIPYTRNTNEVVSRLKAYYVRDNENYDVISASYYDVTKNELVFETNHFSVYAVGYDNTPSNPSTPGGGGGGGGGGSSSSELRDGLHMVNVWLRKTGTKNEPSMANKALNKTAKVVKSGNTYTYTVNFGTLEILNRKGTITRFSIDKNGTKTVVNGSDGEYTFALDEKVDVLKVYFRADIMDELGMGERDAEIVFDWNGTNPAPVETAKIESTVKAQAVLVSDETKPSILNAALNPNVKLVQEGGKYQYTVEFKKIVQGNKSEEIESLGLRVNDQETTPVKGLTINDSQYTRSFIFTFDKKQDKIRVSFKFDNITTDEKEAYITFKETKTDNKDNKTNTAKVMTLKDKVEKVLSKEESKYYSKETLQAIQKAYDQYNKGDKNAEAQLKTLLEKARIEKITYVLGQGYMAGYDGNVFKPNSNISIAEAAVMFAPLIDEEVGEIKDPAVKTKHWYTDAVNKMVALSYIKVKEGENFNPNRSITRAEYAYIVAKLLNYPASDTNLSDIADDYWAKAEISSLVAKGVINGYKDKTFKPENTITRAEAVTIVSRAFPTKADISKKKKFEDVSEKHWAYQYIMAARKN